MASIDKIYGTKNQYDELKSWCKENYPDALNYFYPWYEEWDDSREHPITNFPEKIDKYLLDNCSIDWVINRIKDQYGIK